MEQPPPEIEQPDDKLVRQPDADRIWSNVVQAWRRDVQVQLTRDTVINQEEVYYD